MGKYTLEEENELIEIMRQIYKEAFGIILNRVSDRYGYNVYLKVLEDERCGDGFASCWLLDEQNYEEADKARSDETFRQALVDRCLETIEDWPYWTSWAEWPELKPAGVIVRAYTAEDCAKLGSILQSIYDEALDKVMDNVCVALGKDVSNTIMHDVSTGALGIETCFDFNDEDYTYAARAYVNEDVWQDLVERCVKIISGLDYWDEIEVE